MTRDRIAQLLELFVVETGKSLEPPADVVPALVEKWEWDYIKGIAAGAVLRLRSELLKS